MKRRGPIGPEVVEETLERGGTTFPLWERGPDTTPDLPWSTADDIDRASIGAALRNTERAVLAIGQESTSLSLLAMALDEITSPTRLYVYGDRSLEQDRALVGRLRKLGDRVLVRLGPRPPADWLILDGGRTGWLAVGPSADTRRWMIPVSGATSRSLFEAFRVLFWHRAAREALPDERGTVAFGAPLPAPGRDPGADVVLAAGRLLSGGALSDPIPDAELRVTPTPVDPGPARQVLVPPRAPGGAKRPVSLTLPARLAAEGRAVRWLDAGLPRTSVTHQRMVMDLVDTPHALQIEWPQADAIDLLHRLERAATKAAWTFHPRRRLDAVEGEVLLDGHVEPDAVQPQQHIDVGDVVADLTRFDAARPAALPDPAPLALQVVYRWRRVPPTAPSGARQAALARGWTAVDEWTSRQIDTLRSDLADLDDQTSKLARVFARWWPPQRDAQRTRQRLTDELDELGEARPSQVPDEAGRLVAGIGRIAQQIRALRDAAHTQRQSAEDQQAEADQRQAWQAKIAAARAQLDESTAAHAAADAAAGEAQAALDAASQASDEHISALRRAHATGLEEQVAALDAALRLVLEQQAALTEDPDQTPSRKVRKAAEQKVNKARSTLERAQAALADIEAWQPPSADLSAVRQSVEDARRRLAAAQGERARLAQKIEVDRAVIDTPFVFERPTRLSTPAARSIPDVPPIPDEAPPEIGVLLEHRGQRYLAIETWEQLRPAVGVAGRLAAELVVTPSKR